MAYVQEWAEGTTGWHQSVIRVDIVSERSVPAFVSFLPESGGQRPEIRAEAQLTPDEKAAVLDWLDARWPGNKFHHPPEFWFMRTPKRRP